MQMNSIFKEFENLAVEKKTLSTALGFKLRSFDCRLSAPKPKIKFSEGLLALHGHLDA